MAKPARCNYYEILGLPSPQPGIRLSTEEIKQAYHKALLRHHPDKSTLMGNNYWVKPCPVNETKHTTTTVDDIVLAYKTLSNPSARTEYDRSLLSSQREGLPLHLFGRPTTKDGRLDPGCEVVDLDDLSFDEERSSWYRGCRCGDDKGFVVTEAELEESAAERVVVTGCRGCSLWLQVEFEAADGDDDGGTVRGEDISSSR